MSSGFTEMVCLEIKGGLKKDPTLASGLYTLTSIHTYIVVKAGRQVCMHGGRQVCMHACRKAGRQTGKQYLRWQPWDLKLLN